MKTIKIGTETFTISKKAITGHAITNSWQYHSIFTAYERPSNTKIAIWDAWLKELQEAGAYNIGVASRNCNMFTISFMIEINQMLYIGYISKTKQILTPVNLL